LKKYSFTLTVEVKNDHDEFLLAQAVQRAWFDWQASQLMIKSVSVLPEPPQGGKATRPTPEHVGKREAVEELVKMAKQALEATRPTAPTQQEADKRVARRSGKHPVVFCAQCKHMRDGYTTCKVGLDQTKEKSSCKFECDLEATRPTPKATIAKQAAPRVREAAEILLMIADNLDGTGTAPKGE